MHVPGSLLQIDHPFSWYAIVKEKATGKQFTYWLNGNQLNREAVATWVRTYFPAVELVTADQCTSAPTRMLEPIPPRHYEHGIRRMVEGNDPPPGVVPARNIYRPIQLKPIALRPL